MSSTNLKRGVFLFSVLLLCVVLTVLFLQNKHSVQNEIIGSLETVDQESVFESKILTLSPEGDTDLGPSLGSHLFTIKIVSNCHWVEVLSQDYLFLQAGKFADEVQGSIPLGAGMMMTTPEIETILKDCVTKNKVIKNSIKLFDKGNEILDFKAVNMTNPELNFNVAFNAYSPTTVVVVSENLPNYSATEEEKVWRQVCFCHDFDTFQITLTEYVGSSEKDTFFINDFLELSYYYENDKTKIEKLTVKKDDALVYEYFPQKNESSQFLGIPTISLSDSSYVYGFYDSKTDTLFENMLVLSTWKRGEEPKIVEKFSFIK